MAGRPRRGRRRRRVHRLPGDRGALRRRPRGRRADRRPRHRQARRAQVHVRAWRRHQREGHDPDRRRARQPDEGGQFADWRSTKGASRSSTRSGSRSCGRCRPTGCPRARSSTRWASRSGWRSSAAGSSTHAGRASLSVGFVCGLDYRDPMFDPHIRFQHFKRHPFVASLLAGGQMVRYGAKALPEGGWHTIPRVYADGAADRRRRRRVPELDAPQGHPPGDAHRHARGRDGVRRGRQRRHVGATAARIRGGHRRQRRAAGALSGPQRPPELRLRPARGRGLLRAVAGLRRLVGPGSDARARRLRADAEDRGVLPRRPAGSSMRR